MPEENKMNWDADKGTVTLVKGENSKSFDLSKEEDRTSFMKLGQRGWYYDEDASVELGQLRTVVENWDKAVEAAKVDDAAMEALVNKFELAVGRPITKKEEKQIEKGEAPRILVDDEENAKLVSTIESLNKKISELEESQAGIKKLSEAQKIEALKEKISAEANALEKKYDGKDGAPRFEKQKVFAFASKHKIQDLEKAYKLMNLDSLTEYAKKQAINDLKKQQEKREGSFVEQGDTPAELNINPTSNAKNYHQMGAEVLKSARDSGLSFFTDD